MASLGTHLKPGGRSQELCYVVLDGPYVAHFHNSPNEIFCSMAHYMQNHLSFEKIKDLARGYFLYLIQT